MPSYEGCHKWGLWEHKNIECKCIVIQNYKTWTSIRDLGINHGEINPKEFRNVVIRNKHVAVCPSFVNTKLTVGILATFRYSGVGIFCMDKSTKYIGTV